MEISTDPDGAVYVRWIGGGIWTVLTEDGQVTREHGLGGRTQWFALASSAGHPTWNVTATAPKAATA